MVSSLNSHSLRAEDSIRSGSSPFSPVKVASPSVSCSQPTRAYAAKESITVYPALFPAAS